MTKTEIEKRLHVSRFKVARLLKQAQEEGLIQITIKEDAPDLAEFETRLEKATGLKNVILVRSNGDNSIHLKQKVGQAAAEYLLDVLNDGDTLGIGWGTTTFQLVNALPDSIHRKITVVQVSGGNTKLDTGIDSQALTVRLAAKFNARPHLLHAPAIVDRPETRAMLMEDSSLKKVFGLYKKITFLIGGIGALLPDQFIGSWCTRHEDMDALRRRGAVAEFLSYCFDFNGKHCSSHSEERTIAIPLEDIGKVQCSIGLAVGNEKADAVLGVIRSGCINTLITDTATAKSVWKKTKILTT
jgi:deoxyribonucleoside regulator